MSRAIILVLLAGASSSVLHAAGATRHPRAAVVRVVIAGNGSVHYAYNARKINDTELDRLCMDGIKRKVPVRFLKVGGTKADDEIKFILAKAQCLGAKNVAFMGVDRVADSSAATHKHAKPRHKAKSQP